MKILCLHSDYIKVEPTKKAIKDAEETEKKLLESKEALVVFSAVEKIDEENPENIIKNSAKEIEDVYNQIKAKEILIYPYVHLTKNPSSPAVAKEVINGIYEKLKKKHKVKKAPFGWYKSFEIKVKGHPLAELSREILPEGKEETLEEKIEDGEIEELFVILTNGEIKRREEIEDKNIINAIKSELKEIKETSFGEPPHLRLMRKLEIADNEEISDAGNRRFYPKGAFMVELLRELAWKMAVNDLDAMPVNTPFIINPNDESVEKMMKNFPERLYRVLPGSKEKKQEFKLRPACDYGVWSMLKDATISYKDLPMGLYEFDIIWRYEQSGELLGLYRLRNAMMPNLHEVCANLDQAFERFKDHIEKFGIALYRYLEMNPSIIVLNCKKDFFEEHSEIFKQWTKEFKIPIIVKLFKTMKTYKVAWIDVIAFDNLGRPMEVSTVQLDTESPKWWGIRYKDQNNEDVYPIILHTGFGIERTIATLLENAYSKRKSENPTLPIWISPTQVRLCPINNSLIPYCEKIADELEKNNIRVDIDDRDETTQKKIRDAEIEWIPLIVVIGEREKKSGKLAVRFRINGEIKNMEVKELVKFIRDHTNDTPFKPLPFPRLISRRPKFVGYSENE
ncbi:MAG: threonine--tRNA ligase [Candidatus Aenigmarchaeota archaeon]|nr:threonine--tRNA ligase [Candidatus Aenigmarchaeota archaeon]